MSDNVDDEIVETITRMKAMTTDELADFMKTRAGEEWFPADLDAKAILEDISEDDVRSILAGGKLNGAGAGVELEEDDVRQVAGWSIYRGRMNATGATGCLFMRGTRDDHDERFFVTMAPCVMYLAHRLLTPDQIEAMCASRTGRFELQMVGKLPPEGTIEVSQHGTDAMSPVHYEDALRRNSKSDHIARWNCDCGCGDYAIFSIGWGPEGPAGPRAVWVMMSYGCRVGKRGPDGRPGFELAVAGLENVGEVDDLPDYWKDPSLPHKFSRGLRGVLFAAFA